MSMHSATLPTREPRERGLGWMILVSAALHALAVALALTLPSTVRDRSPKLVSYTVDLVAPDRLGGTNIPGPPPRPAAPKAAAPPPPVAAEQPKPAESAAAPKDAKPPAADQAKEEPRPKVQKDAESKTAPVKVAAKKEPAPKREPKPAPKKEEAPAAKSDAPKPTGQANASEGTKPDLSPEQARAAIAARLREESIAAAVRRAQERLQQSAVASTGTGDPNRPASIGPGEGSGGILKGLDWLMYKNRVETVIRNNWVWTGANKELEAIVRFGITETGEVVHVRIEKSSGDPSYDASVERAVRMASPLPPPPQAYRDDFRDYELTFNPEFLQM